MKIQYNSIWQKHLRSSGDQPIFNYIFTFKVGRELLTPKSTSKGRMKSSVSRTKIQTQHTVSSTAVNVQEWNDFEWSVMHNCIGIASYLLLIEYSLSSCFFRPSMKKRNGHFKMKRAACRQQNNSRRTKFTLSWFKIKLITIVQIELIFVNSILLLWHFK